MLPALCIDMWLVKIWMVLVYAVPALMYHLRVNIIRPALNTCLYNIGPDMIVRHNANAHPCFFDKDGKLGLVFNVYNLNFWAAVSYSSPLLCS